MIRMRWFGLCAVLMLTGCMPKMTVEEMKAMMPERPVELDKLNAFVGEWEFTGEANFAFLEEPLQASGTNEAHWEGDNRFIVSRGVFTMGGLGEMTGHETWTYDTHSKKYRSTWTDSMGAVGFGESRYDEKTNTWFMKATSHGPFGKSTMGGTVKFLDADTMEWTWNEYMMGGLMKVSEMKGTSRRK